jgi:hypothetical protein
LWFPQLIKSRLYHSNIPLIKGIRKPTVAEKAIKSEISQLLSQDPHVVGLRLKGRIGRFNNKLFSQ